MLAFCSHVTYVAFGCLKIHIPRREYVKIIGLKYATTMTGREIVFTVGVSQQRPT